MKMQDNKQKIWIKCKNELFKTETEHSVHVDSVVTVPSFKIEDNWSVFLDRLEDYFAVNKVEYDRRVSVLLTSISEPVYVVLKKLCQPDLPNKKTYNQLSSLLSCHFSGKNTWRERIFFFKLKQGMENITEWYNKVLDRASTCDFGLLLDEHVKNKFLCGMRVGSILDQLCDEQTIKSSKDLLHLALLKEADISHNSSPSVCGEENENQSIPRYSTRQSSERRPLSSRENYINSQFHYSNTKFALSSSHNQLSKPIPNSYIWSKQGGRDDKRGTKRPHNRKDEGDDDDDDAPAPTCLCGLNAKRLTVRGEGPNQGRDFYVCPKNGDKCSLYTWADEVTVQIECFCQLTAKKMTVRKDGPNQGRQFYACPKIHGDADRCKFFVWSDEAESRTLGGGGGGESGRGRGGGRSSFRGRTDVGFSGRGSKTGLSSAKKSKPIPKAASSKFKASGNKDGSAVRKCGICSQPGHNRRNCPQAND